ncbi:hypothetical protein EYF88_01420 [Paracoccus sediminis]|uniref:Serine dehydrogenase proteinase n=1 Tax=Paracoccus sediminis TaxID=1214787 RepID=A0A238USP7_9RHOB|nr:hypothetical protein [Paracoccus sediminis]TBN52894.1 hypothetical protein EYF88_01420 [Paracoccus sediminis]SNR24717.1 Serine dehydrogenase proteinase [Paracoccus sediminis]
MSSTDIIALANTISAERNAAVIVYSGRIDTEGFGKLLEALQISEAQPQRENVLLILTTNGGLANAAYQIARLLQQSFTKFEVFVPSYCKSAGTLITLGAHSLIMEVIAELGPLDVQLFQKDEIGQRRSGLILRNAFDGLSQETMQTFEKIMLGIKIASVGTVSFETASRIAAAIASQVMAPVYAQISPEALGNDLRDLNVATQYGQRLVADGKNAKPGAVEALVHSYPAHDFIIDGEEAKLLFESVESPDVNLSKLMQSLGSLVYSVQNPQLVIRLDREKGENTDESKVTEEDEKSLSIKAEPAENSDLVVGREGERQCDPTRGSSSESRIGELSKGGNAEA